MQVYLPSGTLIGRKIIDLSRILGEHLAGSALGDHSAGLTASRGESSSRRQRAELKER